MRRRSKKESNNDPLLSSSISLLCYKIHLVVVVVDNTSICCLADPSLSLSLFIRSSSSSLSFLNFLSLSLSLSQYGFPRKRKNVVGSSRPLFLLSQYYKSYCDIIIGESERDKRVQRLLFSGFCNFMRL